MACLLGAAFVGGLLVGALGGVLGVAKKVRDLW